MPIKVVLLIHLLSLSLVLASCGEIVVEKQVVYVDRPIEVIREVEKPVEILVYHTVEVEKVVEVERQVVEPLADWTNREELSAFLMADDTDSIAILVAGPDGVVRLSGQCEERAIQLMDNAAKVGKRLSFVPLHPLEYVKWYGSYTGNDIYHAICGALVGDNEFYYIEPNTDECWLAQYLD